MHQHYQNKLALQQEQKSIINLTDLRQHTASADKKEYFDGAIFQYLFTNLMYEITLFLLISTLSLYLISNFLGEVLIRGQHLKEVGVYLKVREIHHIRFQNFVFVLFNKKIETQKLRTNQKKRKKKKKKNENIKISAIVSLLKRLYHHTI